MDHTIQAPESMRQAFARLAEVVYASDSYEDVYTALCTTATRVVPGCDHASLMVLRGGTFETLAASDEIGRSIDAAERRLGTGPCLDAIISEAAQVDPDLRTEPTWPVLAEWILANTPVVGAAGFRLVAGGEKVGAFNFFSDRPGALTDSAADLASVFTAFTSVSLAAAHERERAQHLRVALGSNREIGKAVGLLMALHRIDDVAAFELLRTTSQDLNIKLAEVAGEVVRHHGTRPATPTADA